MSEATFHGGRVVIIGGGVIGLSIAYHLTARGHQEVTVVERQTLGSETSSKGSGGIRQQFSSEINIMLSRRAVEYFANFADRVGEKIRFTQNGYLFLIDNLEQLAAFRTNASKQQKADVPVQLLDPAEIPDIMPYVTLEGLVGASYCPTDGSGSAADVVAAFTRRARAQGASLLEETKVIAIEQNEHEAVRRVHTTSGVLDAEIVINAAGPWAAEVGKLLNLSLPITPHRRQASSIAPLPWFTEDLPMTVDLSSGSYLHPARDGGVIGGNDRQTPPGFQDDVVDWDLTSALMSNLIHRMPAMSNAKIQHSWVGFRDMTPDDHAILGPVEEVPGFWVVAGFSGHGFMHSPVVGDLLSGWILDGAPVIDLASLQLERFKAGTSTVETTVF